MKTVQIAEAKMHLSELLASLKVGEEVTITRYGVAVAKLTGIASSTITFRSDAGTRLRKLAVDLKAGSFSDDELVGFVQAGRR